MPTVFLISPARCNGPRAELLMTSRTFTLAAQLQSSGAAIGDIFAWLSALYFRGKLTYAKTFAPRSHSFVMAPGAGLVAPDTTITAAELRAMGGIDVESDGFIAPLRRDALALADRHGAGLEVVLLGSIATGKYIATLLEVFGARLVFPATFVGRGDMSRGGLLLRAAREAEELAYEPVQGAVLHGKRPAKLPKLPRRA